MVDISKIDKDKLSVFDLTTDEKILLKIFHEPVTKEQHLKTASDSGRITTMIEYAELVDDSILLQKLEGLYKDELASLFNE